MKKATFQYCTWYFVQWSCTCTCLDWMMRALRTFWWIHLIRDNPGHGRWNSYEDNLQIRHFHQYNFVSYSTVHGALSPANFFFRKGKGGTGFRIIINDTPILIPHPISTTFPDKCCLANEVGNAITWAIYTRRTDKFIESRNSASLSQIRVAWFVESGLSHERINV